MTEATWPIRIGGEYYSTNMKHVFARVTEIDAERVYWDLFRDDYLATNGFCGKHSQPLSIFRAMYAPEDQSPIPALVEALTELGSLVREGLRNGFSEDLGSQLGYAYERSFDALAKAQRGETEGAR